MPTYAVIVDDSFQHAGTSPGGAGSTTGMPTTPSVGAANGWTDYHGGVWQIGSGVPNTGVGVDPGNHRPTGQLNAALRLTTAEKCINQRIIVDFDNIDSNELELYAVGRYTGSGNCYACCLFQSGGNGFIRIWAPDGSNNGANPIYSSPSSLGAFNAAHNHRLQVDIVGTSPTTFTFTWTDLTTSTVVGTVSTTDSTAALQTAGAAGLCVANAGTAIINRFQLFSGDALNAGTLAPDVSNTTSTAVRLNVTAATGGTAPLTQKIYRHTAATFTPPGQGTLVSTSPGSTFTDTPGGNPGDLFFYKPFVVDSAGTPLTAYGLSVAACTKFGTVKLGFVGDSILATLFGSYPAVFPAEWAARYPLYPVTCTSAAVSGTSTADWMSGSGNLTSAIAAFTAAGVTHVVWMLGANDSRTPNSFSAATYQSQTASGVNALVSAGFKVILCAAYLPYLENNPAGTWTDAAMDLLAAYPAQLDALVNGTTILKGDRQAHRVFPMNAPADYFAGDQIHPVYTAGYTALCDCLTTAVAGALGITTSPGVAGGGAGGRVGMRTGGRL
jgi:hypothetical protein